MQKSRMIETRGLVALGDDKNCLYSDWNNGYTSVYTYICLCIMCVYVCVCVFLSKLIELCTLKSVYFIMCKLYLNFYYYYF